MKAKKIFVIAGDISAEKYALEFLSNYPEPIAQVSGIGGTKLEKWGMNITLRNDNLSVIGFTQILKRLFFFLRILKQTQEDIIKLQPDFILMIDFPGFNLRLAKQLKHLGIPIYYYVPPQLFAWRQKRIEILAKTVDQVFYFYPIEKKALTHPQLKITRVRQPLTHEINPHTPQFPIAKIHLLPGSRGGELKMHIPLFETLRPLLEKDGIAVKYCIGQDHNRQRCLDHGLPEHLIESTPIKELESDFIICASGTVTLELALRNIPLIVVYKMGFINYHIIKMLIKIPYVSLPNLILEKHLVPELLGYNLSAQTIYETLQKLKQEDISKQHQGFADIRKILAAPKALAEHLAQIINE